MGLGGFDGVDLGVVGRFFLGLMKLAAATGSRPFRPGEAAFVVIGGVSSAAPGLDLPAGEAFVLISGLGWSTVTVVMDLLIGGDRAAPATGPLPLGDTASPWLGRVVTCPLGVLTDGGLVPFGLADGLRDDAMDLPTEGARDRCLPLTLGVAGGFEEPTLLLLLDAAPIDDVRFFCAGAPDGLFGVTGPTSGKPATATLANAEGGAVVRREFGARPGMDVDNLGFGLVGTGVASGSRSRDRCFNVNGDWLCPVVDVDVRLACGMVD